LRRGRRMSSWRRVGRQNEAGEGSSAGAAEEPVALMGDAKTTVT
jgi:hypothetical protein